MNACHIDEQRRVLNHRRQEVDGQLQALAAQEESLDQKTYRERRNTLLNEIHEIEHRLDDIYIDELSLQHMEGNE